MIKFINGVILFLAILTLLGSSTMVAITAYRGDYGYTFIFTICTVQLLTLSIVQVKGGLT